ncbi:MAG TPA: patatin-like phospholipase family protein [Flavisolibacter sp.]|nr:patatin-like phospholipase family protein [Flavisolibacter sp.]
MPLHSPLNHLGVSLSGGGYRASAFHLGTLRALHKLGILERIDVLSTISGGSITGAAYCLHKGNYMAFEKEMIEKISTKNVIGHVLASRFFLQLALFTLVFLGTGIYLLFTAYAWAFLPLLGLWLFLLLRFQFRIFPAGRAIEEAYDKFYFKGATLNDLCRQPVLAIGSSNLQTGRPFSFSWRKMSDSTYASFDPPIRFRQRDFPVARAVTASSCVPFAFTPVSIDEIFFENKADFRRIDPKLIDGGVYDNQGIQKLTQQGSSYECRIIITSDAGGRLSFDGRYGNTLSLLIRTVDLFMNRIKAFQMVENIYQNVGSVNKEIAYLSLGWDLERCIPGFVDNMIKGLVTASVIEAHGFEPAWIRDPKAHRTEIEACLKERTDYASIVSRNLSAEELRAARSTGTNLTPLLRERIGLLASHAENLTELQVKLYCPSLIFKS